ncbi:hypothetical protein GCM10023169_33320 [Georgenia halophila]|uniref:AB hydrolase-1 domain-containing protein n=1 Tax=Georgenia halophila TaxID=620889 RepID=A0ABP8LI68_9MICO
MEHVTSFDGTRIAYDANGSGPPVILVAGALGGRPTWQPLVHSLGDTVTTYAYDRRNRGGSSDAAKVNRCVPVAGAVERELEDLSALIDEAGGSAVLVGYSSGCQLAVLAAARDERVSGLVLYEPPYNDGSEDEAMAPGMPGRLAYLVSHDRSGDAVRTWLGEVVGLPEDMVAGIEASPEFATMEADAGSLVYDAALQSEHPTVRPVADGVRVPTLVVRGGDTWPFLATASQAVADLIPAAELRTVEGADHTLVPDAVAPAVLDLVARAGRATASTTFVICHGAGGSGWEWHLVRDELTARGHRVVATDMPSEDDGAGLADYADAVVSAVRAEYGDVDGRDVVVVGHSLGGFVAPLAADRLRARHLVLVAAMIPLPRETAGEWWQTSGFTATQREEYDDEVAAFLHDLDPDLAAEALRRSRNQSGRMMADPFPLPAWPDIPTSFLVFRDDRFFPAPFLHRLARERLGVEADEMPGSHAAYLSRPTELADRLLAYAGAAAPSAQPAT